MYEKRFVQIFLSDVMWHTFESITFTVCYIAIFDNFGPMMIYMQAVHSGADLESAISNSMGYQSQVLSVTGWTCPTWCSFLSI